MDNLHVIVGLGNPGGEYDRTRHNAGFLVLDQLAGRWKASWRLERKFEALVVRAMANDALLCKPQTYMNASGQAVRLVAGFYQVPPVRCLVIVDDADLPLGEIRLRPKGSSGGHHGLESIEEHLGTNGFPRLRVGIGRKAGQREITGHVLGRFSKGESEVLELVLARAASQVECWMREGLQKAMNQFNGTVACPENEGNEK